MSAFAALRKLIVCVEECVYVCMCVKNKYKETDKERDRQTERKKGGSLPIEQSCRNFG